MRRSATLLTLAIVLAAHSVAHAAPRTEAELTADAKARQAGVLPVGDDGKPLNTDFETGDLRDWTASGDAFAGQPIKGDAVNLRRGDIPARILSSICICS